MSEIKELLLDLAKIESITASPDGEKQAAEFIFNRLSKLDYFKKNKNLLRRIDINGKNYFSISALVKAIKPTNRTVILTGHFDVVDAEDCGALKQWAFDPEEYTKRIAEIKEKISPDARADLESGRYLFGRGVADMKLGIAIEMNIIEEFSRQPDMFDVNVLFLAVADEEGDSCGMRGSIEHLLELQNEGLEFLACVNTEPSFVDGAHENLPAIFDGTIGKIMPFFMCVGKETHVGQYDDGINSLLMASLLNISFEGGERKVACLYMRDQRKSYAVTLPERTAMYFNYMSMDDTPETVLALMRTHAERALARWNPRIMTVEELMKKSPDQKFSISENLDERERNIEVIHKLLDISGEKGPLVVMGFLPPFYPSRKNKKIAYIEDAISKLGEFSVDNFSLPLYRAGIMLGITDLSFTGFDGDASALDALSRNLPLWEKGYEIPLDALSKIDIPVLNLGPVGKDCHKLTERADMKFSLEILPSLLRYLIKVL